jgi:hypothetical protein
MRKAARRGARIEGRRTCEGKGDMSRLDSFIRRLEAQRACLELAAARIAGLPGPALELGLGNGRTYDHLRALLPEREIFVFEREVNAHPDCIPDAAHLILGDVRATLPQARRLLPGKAALAHSDVGTGDAAANAELAAWLAARRGRLGGLRPGAAGAGPGPAGGACRYRARPLLSLSG